jgi:hypothetical protein
MSRVTIDLHIQMLCAVLHVSHILGTQAFLEQRTQVRTKQLLAFSTSKGTSSSSLTLLRQERMLKGLLGC